MKLASPLRTSAAFTPTSAMDSSAARSALALGATVGVANQSSMGISGPLQDAGNGCSDGHCPLNKWLSGERTINDLRWDRVRGCL
jgi:hypothetical protein